MYLRNKKTGEVVDWSFVGPTAIKEYEGEDVLLDRERYESIEELNAEWEDYTPAEPLIKDEKIKKAVRAWADANGIGGCICKEEIHCITFETERGMFISFEDAGPIPPEGNFTIAELCGEEEE